MRRDRQRHRLAAYLALPGQRTFDLGDLVQRYLHRTLDTEHRAPTAANSR